MSLQQVAIRLGQPSDIESWNPCPSKNRQFDWLKAVQLTEIANKSHLHDLASRLPFPDYKMVEVFAWKSKVLREMGETSEARIAAEESIARAKTGSWHRWLDGASKKASYSALMEIDKETALESARKQFGLDVSKGKFNGPYHLRDIIDTLEFLEIAWPGFSICTFIDDYLIRVLDANEPVKPFLSLQHWEPAANQLSVDGAICKVLVQLLAFPVVDVGSAVRRAISKYCCLNGDGIVDLVKNDPCWDSVQIENLLVALHISSRANNSTVEKIREWIEGLNDHESLGVRAIARRISDEQGWNWQEVRNRQKKPTILVSSDLDDAGNYEQARMLLDGDVAIGFRFHSYIFETLESLGNDRNELQSEFIRSFREIEKDYAWADEDRKNLWMKLVRARHWLNPRIIIGREAAMRVLGCRALCGQGPVDAEMSYDQFYPIYDPDLELLQPNERPNEMLAMNWDHWDEVGKAWLRGENADNWVHYPEGVGDLKIIGERSWFIRPDWEWPREERYRGVTVGALADDETRHVFDSEFELTFQNYLQGSGQDEKQVIISNAERQLLGPVYRWVAINSNFARSLGWTPLDNQPFSWVDSSNDLMVKSIFWKDGWIWVEPPEFQSLGEGWLVLASQKGIKEIQNASDELEMHLWVERHCHNEKEYQDSWHLAKNIK